MRERLIKITILFLAVAVPLHASRGRPASQAQAATSGLQAGQYPENLVEGRGAPRTSYADCVGSLPSLSKALAARGMRLTETPSCSPISGNVENYAPFFRAWAPEKYSFREIAGGTYNSEAVCDSVAQAMQSEIQKSKQKVLETGCLGTKSDQSSTSSILFQPVAVVIDSGA